MMVGWVFCPGEGSFLKLPGSPGDKSLNNYYLQFYPDGSLCYSFMYRALPQPPPPHLYCKILNIALLKVDIMTSD